MAELKTKLNEKSVTKFLNSVEDENKRQDSFEVLNYMEEITGAKAKMWGDSIVGFGSYRYRYKTGREGDWMLCGFSPRKQALTLYIMSGFNKYEDLLKRLGKFKTGKSCLYIKRLSDVDQEVLKELIGQSVEYLRRKEER